MPMNMLIFTILIHHLPLIHAVQYHNRIYEFVSSIIKVKTDFILISNFAIKKEICQVYY